MPAFSSRVGFLGGNADRPAPTHWRTLHGIGVPTVTAGTMAEVDRVAIEETGPNLYQMMENAGRSLALAALGLVEPDGPGTVAVIAGKGGNGGGGICAARHLKNHGVDVVVHVTDLGDLGEVPGQQLDIYRSAGGRVEPIDQIDLSGSGLIVDAVVGYSLRGAPRGIVADAISAINDAGAPVLSLDVPSGVSTSGDRSEGESVKADFTVTLALPKTGLHPDNAGEVTLADLGIPATVFARSGVVGYPPRLFGSGFSVPINYEA